MQRMFAMTVETTRERSLRIEDSLQGLKPLILIGVVLVLLEGTIFFDIKSAFLEKLFMVVVAAALGAWLYWRSQSNLRHYLRCAFHRTNQIVNDKRGNTRWEQLKHRAMEEKHPRAMEDFVRRLALHINVARAVGDEATIEKLLATYEELDIPTPCLY